MKRKIMGISITAILIFLVVTIGLTFQNEPEGFRDLKWGDPPLQDMIIFTGKKGDIRKLYELPNDKMYLGDVELYMILYGFYDQLERFMDIGLFFKGEENFNLLKTICRGKFGKETDEGFYSLTWMSPKTMVYLSYDIIEESGSLSLTDMIIFSEYLEAKEKKETEKAEKDW